jgi:hypothetical protein
MNKQQVLRLAEKGEGPLGDNVASDEPVWILPASDPFCGDMIRDWCTKVLMHPETSLVPEVNPLIADDPDAVAPEVVDEARRLAKDADAYRLKRISETGGRLRRPPPA